MAYLNPDGDYVEPSRVEATEYKPRFLVDGKPVWGVFTLDELRAAYPDSALLRRAILNGGFVIDATQRHECGKVTSHGD